MEDPQKANDPTLADLYAESAFKEGVLQGRQQATSVLLEVLSENLRGAKLVAEFVQRLGGRPYPEFQRKD